MSIGIDAGSKSFGVYILEDKKHYEFLTTEIKGDPESFVEFLRSIEFEVGAGLSGYGLPPKRMGEIDDKEFFQMTLSMEKEQSLGLRRIIELIRMEKLNIFTIPAVIHLPTVPAHRKMNRIDMGTYDKVCSVAYALYNYGVEESFILAELGYGFNAFIAVKNGKIVDGIGGTSGFPGYLSLSAIDLELAHLIGEIPKEMTFKGGMKSYFEERGLEFDEDIFSEWVLKGIHALQAVVKTERVYLSGRFSKRAYKAVKEEFDAVVLDRDGKISAIGASIIASGYGNKDGREVVEQLELLRATGSVFDHLTRDVKEMLRHHHIF